jgi:hypothetical protein
MKRIALVLVAVLACGCDEGTTNPGEDVLPTQVTCTLLSPSADQLVHDGLDVQIGFTGPVAVVELLVADAAAGQTDVPEGSIDPVTLSWDSTDSADGTVELSARVAAADGTEAFCEPRSVDVDNTAPVIEFGVERLGLVRGTDGVPLTIDEPHLASVRASDQFGEIYNGPIEGTPAMLPWDTTTAEDRIHYMALEATDEAGHTARIDNFPLIVANYGDEFTVTYDPAAELYIPTDYATVEFHTRATVDTHAGVKRLIAWITWDATESWNIQFAIGEGLCPHRGITFLDGESDTGEIILELDRSELPSYIVSRFDTEWRSLSTFPTNSDPLTYGTFFGHATPTEPADHVDQTLPIEVHYVLIDEPPTA